MRIDPKTWLEISEDALRHNAELLRAALGTGTRLMAVVKSNAYGHGAAIVGNALASHADWFGVDSLHEALALREAGVASPVLILGYTPSSNADDLVAAGFSQVCYDLDMATAFSRVATPDRPAKLHIKIETGTSRQGIHRYDLPAFLGRVKELPNVVVEGASTHYANIEDTDDPSFARQQLAHFEDALTVFRDLNVHPTILHTACSAAALLYPHTHFDMARVGITLYGLWPSEGTRNAVERAHPGLALRPALAWKTRVAQVKRLAAGTPVSYGLTEAVTRDSIIAVLPVGYWDGYDRGFSSRAEVLVGGKRAKVLGRVCMNMCVVDVTDIPGVRAEDEVVLLGAQGSARITAEELAAHADTINYEIVTRINPTLPRRSVV